jgi:RNase H-like domain found in reverse transcriptase
MPTKVRDVRSFLGFCNFYHLFIKGFVAIAKPLNELTTKTVEWTWGPTQWKVFDMLKHRVTSEPVLAHLVLQDQFELEVDVSGFTVGVVLLQRKKDSK